MEAVEEYFQMLKWRRYWNRPITAATLKTLMRSADVTAWIPGPAGSDQCTMVRSGLAIRVLNRRLKRSGDRYILEVPKQLTIMDPTEKVRHLATLPQPAQLSPEWFEMRGSALTASVIGAALGVSKYDKPIDVMLKKCGLGPPFKGNAATYHGQKYEEVAVQVYEYRTGAVVGEFGLLSVPLLDFLKASPDGIVTRMQNDDGDQTPKLREGIKVEARFGGRDRWFKGKITRKRSDGTFDILYDDGNTERRVKRELIRVPGDITGRALEIKVPSSRNIRLADGSANITPWYHWQMLLQMEATSLDTCDHLQMKIEEYDDRDQYRDDQDPERPGHTAAGFEKSCLLQWGDQTVGNAKFRYGPIGKDIRTLDRWLCDEMDLPPPGHTEEPRVIWWHCKDYVCTTIARDTKKFNEALPKLGKLWDEVMRHRANACFELKKYVPVTPVRTITYRNRTIRAAAPPTEMSKKNQKIRMVIDSDDE